MVVSTKIPNQANFQDPQNFDIDIDKIFSDLIQEIDAVRSVVNISNPVNQAILNTLSGTTIAGLVQSLKAERTPQESRLHAFYRLIGFPVVSKDSIRFYNPGYDKIFDPNKTISLDDKIGIADNPFNNFQPISTQREQYVNDIAKVFSVNKTITASVLALSSSSHVRPFNVLAKESNDPFDFSAENQSEPPPDLHGLIGFNNRVLLTDYIDEFGNKPNTSLLKIKRFHFIKPFMVDPRIDFTVSPASRRVAVPFVPNKSDLLIGENTFVKRPLIEKVIRDRLTVQNQQNTLGTAGQTFANYVLSVPSVQDEPLIKQMAANDPYKLGDQLQFIKYFDIIRTMCAKLVDAQLKIQRIQSKYYWLPIPSTKGPEDGSQVRDVIISSQLPEDFITPADRAIINATLKQTASQFNAQSASNTGTPDIGGFAFESFATTFDRDTTEAFGNVVEKQLDAQKKIRSHDLAIANDALRTVEIIMGEFSGLGLCDIIAIMGALYIMPQSDILGFLDDDAIVRLVKLPDINTTGISSPGIVKAQQSFIVKVKDFYNIMDKIYKDLRQGNGLSD